MMLLNKTEWVYIKCFDETKYMPVIIKNIKVWDKVGNLIKKGLDSKLVYDNKYIKSKVKSFGGKINTKFYDNDFPYEGVHCVCLSVILRWVSL